MPVVVVNIYYALGILLLVLGLPLLIATFIVRRWKHNMDVSGDAHYVETLAMLSEGSVRRHFNPYTDIDWDAPDFSVTAMTRVGWFLRQNRSGAIRGTSHNRWTNRSRSGCGVRPTSSRLRSTSKACWSGV